MKALVTGGNGFIGRHVVNELCSRKIEVISLDIASPVEVSKEVQHINDTIMDRKALSSYMKGCDAVFHLAAILGVKRADKYLVRCMNINILGTTNVLEACLLSNVPYIFLTSSSEVYGSITEEKISEKDLLNPRSGYAISKLAAEEFTKGMSREFGLEYNIGRLFNVYGPGQVSEFVIPRFIKMVEKDLPPTIYGDGKQIRSFCHIKDSSRAIVDVFLNKDLRNDMFNIGNDLEPITVAEVANKILSKMNSNLAPKRIPFSKTDRSESREIYNRTPDISKLKQAIGFAPRIRLDDGIADLIRVGNIPESWHDPIISNNL